MKQFSKLSAKCLCLLFGLSALATTPKNTLEKRLDGIWALTGVTCNGSKQDIAMDYTLSFKGKTGAYVSKNKACTQVEPELYTYPTADSVTIKQGVRECSPTPCQADLPAAQCGKETNPQTPTFKVEFKNNRKTMILSTSDPKSIDCTDPGQGKPAVFTFVRR